MQFQINEPDRWIAPGSEHLTEVDPDRRIRLDAPKTAEAPRLTLDQMMMMEMV